MAGKVRSLRLELIATLAVVLMMAAVSLSLVSEVLAHQRHRAQEIERIEHHTRALAMLAAPAMGASGDASRPELEQMLRPSLGTLGIVAIEIHRVRGDRRQVLSSLGFAPPLPAALNEPGPALPRAEELKDGSVVAEHPVRTFSASDRGALSLRVVAKPDSFSRGGEWQNTLVLALGVGFVLVVLGGLLLEIQVLRPLAAVRHAAQRVSAGDLKARAPEDGPAEIRAVAHAFNATTEALSEKIDEVSAQRSQLVRAEQLASVGRISAGVAHEVGNPLAALLGYVELLLDPRTDPPLSTEQRGLLERSQQQIERIQSTVGQLLEYSRPNQAAAQQAPVQTFDLTAVSRNLVDLVRHDPRVSGASLHVSGPDAVMARGNPGQVEQILQNLIVNAARAAGSQSGADAKVVVSVSSQGERAQVDVRDNGPGIDAEARGQIFEPFFSTAAAGEGSGLGLAICQGLAEGMHGSVRALPNPADGGAVFRLDLPAGPQS